MGEAVWKPITYEHVSVANVYKQFVMRRYGLFTPIMTFDCDPIKIELHLRTIWHPQEGQLIKDDDGNWQGEVTLPIGKAHVRIRSYVTSILNAFQRYDIVIHVPRGFLGKASILVGFATLKRRNDTIPYAEWALEGDPMTLTTVKYPTSRKDIWRQGLNSDQGKQGSLYTLFTRDIY